MFTPGASTPWYVTRCLRGRGTKEAQPLDQHLWLQTPHESCRLSTSSLTNTQRDHQLPARGLRACFLAHKLIADFEPSHRSARSAQAADYSLVIDESELTNSRQNGIGSIFG
ncbi:MAG: hypothetical protein ACI85K_002383 [Hyphomicrobiaceae bacterium]|jgi:hypothetical protein